MADAQNVSTIGDAQTGAATGTTARRGRKPGSKNVKRADAGVDLPVSIESSAGRATGGTTRRQRSRNRAGLQAGGALGDLDYFGRYGYIRDVKLRNAMDHAFVEGYLEGKGVDAPNWRGGGGGAGMRAIGGTGGTGGTSTTRRSRSARGSRAGVKASTARSRGSRAGGGIAATRGRKAGRRAKT